MTVTLDEITDANREAVLALRVAAGQEKFVAGVPKSLADADRYPQASPWCRVIADDGEPVGFVMVSWNPPPQPPDIPGGFYLWRLLIGESHQGHGYGAAAIRLLTDLIRAEGATEMLVSYVPGDGSPAGFYERLGFQPTGEQNPAGEVVLRLPLSPERD